MALRLKKLKPAQWLGNGFGDSSATWGLKDHEGWEIYALGSGWKAVRARDCASVRADTRTVLLEKLERFLAREERWG